MSYIRVLPRDLFNEANFLKCIGRLWICLEKINSDKIRFNQESVESFDIVQNQDDGSLTIENITINMNGEDYIFNRPLNSREPWPLYLVRKDDPYGDMIPVFNEYDVAGSLSQEFLEGI